MCRLLFPSAMLCRALTGEATERVLLLRWKSALRSSSRSRYMSYKLASYSLAALLTRFTADDEGGIRLDVGASCRLRAMGGSDCSAGSLSRLAFCCRGYPNPVVVAFPSARDGDVGTLARGVVPPLPVVVVLAGRRSVLRSTSSSGGTGLRIEGFLVRAVDCKGKARSSQTLAPHFSSSPFTSHLY
jgi:hypothetical protein